MSAAMTVLLMTVGEKLGIYKALAGAGPMTPAELAKKTVSRSAPFREWLSNQAATGYVTYDAASERFELPGGACLRTGR